MLLRGSLDYTGVFYFMRVSVFMHTCICAPCVCPVRDESEEGIESPGTGLKTVVSCHVPLQEEPMFFTTEPSLQKNSIFFTKAGRLNGAMSKRDTPG